MRSILRSFVGDEDAFAFVEEGFTIASHSENMMPPPSADTSFVFQEAFALRHLKLS